MSQAPPFEGDRKSRDKTSPPKNKGDTVVGRVTRRLRAQALATPAGALIGSEDQLLASYGVSRATLRKAAALVRQEQLIQVRPGIGGGYYARRPEVDGVAHIAAIYLQSKRATVEEIIKAIEPLHCEMGMLAAQNRNPETMQLWRAFQERDAQASAAGGYRDFLRLSREFGQILGIACQNSVLDLFVATLHEVCGFFGPEEDIFRDRPNRVREYWSRRQTHVAAIIDGDVELTSFAARRCARLITNWMVEDMAVSPSEFAPLYRLLG